MNTIRWNICFVSHCISLWLNKDSSYKICYFFLISSLFFFPSLFFISFSLLISALKFYIRTLSIYFFPSLFYLHCLLYLALFLIVDTKSIKIITFQTGQNCDNVTCANEVLLFFSTVACPMITATTPDGVGEIRTIICDFDHSKYSRSPFLTHTHVKTLLNPKVLNCPIKRSCNKMKWHISIHLRQQICRSESKLE